ncbi:FAD-dependent oxidoreductase [Microbacterium sp. W1N]|uniref:FAD-dependent oxidoreductase n=1 Tax=Microbacterium festucae TaxID=2977531 RepID=UPI0021BE2A2D|nr:FAD-dependent oxidoreductase [Microbacterium festucae]MCT9820806.1 FAD-dependent oxidoreductase [Microbacterium festucae]
MEAKTLTSDLIVIGGGLGGVAAAQAALEAGRSVILTEENLWLGGQLTSQLVPTDEHLFIETTGANSSYRSFREALRQYYRDHFPLTEDARRDPLLNPGAAWVSPISVDPRVAVSVISNMLMAYESADRLTVLTRTRAIAVGTEGDRVTEVTVRGEDGQVTQLRAPFVIDATELGDLLALGGVEYVSGRESREMTGEPHAAETADPTDMQGATWCFAIDYREGEDHTIERPAEYEKFRDWEPEQLDHERLLSLGDTIEPGQKPDRLWRLELNPDDAYPFPDVDLDHRNMGNSPDLWTYRRIAARHQFAPGFYTSDITIVNWPMNDYVGGALFDVPDAAHHWEQAKELAKSLLYWLQTDVPRPDGGKGYPGIRLRADIAGTADGFAQYPYIRESRRIVAKQTIVEQEVALSVRGDQPAPVYPDSVGVGHYFWIDRHPSTVSGRHQSDLPQPFEIPLGALIPQRVRNLLPACKNIGTTQITNGCYRLHPVEWSIGEAAGALAAFCIDRGIDSHELYADADLVDAYQQTLVDRGVQLHWPEGTRWGWER